MLGSNTPLRVFGPSNIIECVAGKLKGYAWNLISNYPLSIETYGIDEDMIRRVDFPAKERFGPVEHPPVKKPADGVVLKNDYFRVKAAVLEHDIESIGWSLEEDFHINIDKSRLAAMGLEPGPWLTEFKKRVRAGWPGDSVFTFSAGPGRMEMELGELKKRIATITRGQKVSYVMDSSPTPENIRKITALAAGSDTLYLEAYFLDEDMERARQRNHLTAGLAGNIARNAGVKNLHIMHYSPKYSHQAEAIAREASEAFGARVHEASPYVANSGLDDRI